jgi:hypothetical protein
LRFASDGMRGSSLVIIGPHFLVIFFLFRVGSFLSPLIAKFDLKLRTLSGEIIGSDSSLSDKHITSLFTEGRWTGR